MTKSPSYRIVLSGMLIAAGLLLSFVTAHVFGLPGTVLLPMHIPVFLIGLLCGPRYGAINGAIIPVLSSLLTGMPVAFPMLPIMIGELFTYGFISGLLYQKAKKPLYPSMLAAMFCGRMVYGLIFSALLTVNNGTLMALSVSGAFVQGLPGIAIQLVLVPVIVTAVNRYWNQGTVRKSLAASVEKARRIIKDGKASCVVIKDDVIVRVASGQGVAPLIAMYESEPHILNDAFVVDKVIGKASAMLLVLGGVNKVYGEVMSVAAHKYLTERCFQFEYGRCVDIISNRTGNGICPLEKSVLEINDPEIGYHLLKETIKQLRTAG